MINVGTRKRRKPEPEILLCPNIPKPLHGLNPRTLLGQKWWDVTRRRAYAERDHSCWACGAINTRLEAHELYDYDFLKFSAVLSRVTALCTLCHNFIHSGRLEHLYSKGEVSREFYGEVHSHGTTQLIKADLMDEKKRVNAEIVRQIGDETKNWDKWHLVIENRKFLPLFSSYKDWYEYYNPSRKKRKISRGAYYSDSFFDDFRDEEAFSDPSFEDFNSFGD